MFRSRYTLLVVSLFVVNSPKSCWSGTVAVQGGSLISYDPEANCILYRPVVCDELASVPVSDNTLDSNSDCKDLECASHYDSSCITRTHSVLNGQFILRNENGYSIRISWQELPASCNISSYTVIYGNGEAENSTCNYLKEHNSDISDCTPQTFSPEITDVDSGYTWFPNNQNNNHMFFKVIANPVYEWPLLALILPVFSDDLNCKGCSDNTTPPSGIAVNVQSHSDGSMIANVSWNHDDSATKYYLHINSSMEKLLFQVEGDISHAVITGLYAYDEYCIWLEKFTCRCSNSSLVYVIPEGSGDYNDMVFSTTKVTSHATTSSSMETIVMTTSPSSINSSNHVSMETIVMTTSPSSINNNNRVSMETIVMTTSTSSINSSNHVSMETIVMTTSPSSINRVSMETIVMTTSPSIDSNNVVSLSIYYTPVIVLVGIMIFLIIGVIFLIMLIRRQRNKVIHEVQVETPIAGMPLETDITVIPPYKVHRPHSVINTVSLPTKVMLIYSTETSENEVEQILTFLKGDLEDIADTDDHRLINVLYYDKSTQRSQPSSWVEKTYKEVSFVLCVVDKKFCREWNDEVRPDTPVVYSFQQLFNSLFSSKEDLSKIIVIVHDKSEGDQNIPSHYLKGRPRFAIDDTEGLAYILTQKPKYRLNDSILEQSV